MLVTTKIAVGTWKNREVYEPSQTHCILGEKRESILIYPWLERHPPLRNPISRWTFFCLVLLQAISLSDHNVMIQAICCPAYSMFSFWVSGCAFLGSQFNCWWRAAADLQVLCCYVPHQSINLGEVHGIARFPSCINAGWYLFEAVGAKQSYQSSRVVGQATAERRGVMVQNGSPEHFFLIASLYFSSKTSPGRREFT